MIELIVTYGTYVVDFAVLAIILAFLVRFTSYRQSPGMAFVRDDSKSEALSDIVRGKNDVDTSLFADCAAMSANIYLERGNYTDTDDIRALGARRITVDGWVEEDRLYNEELDERNAGRLFGLLYEVWKNQEHRIVAIVFRGTVLGASSLIANLHWLFRYIPLVVDQYDQIKELTPNILAGLSEEISSGYRIIATGHSLGGGLAQHSVYISRDITVAVAFNASPVTGWADVERAERLKNASGTKVYRVHENGEGLEFLRLLMKIGYVFNPRPNVDPCFVEYRLNLMGGGVVKQHGIAPLAYALRSARKNLSAD